MNRRSAGLLVGTGIVATLVVAVLARGSLWGGKDNPRTDRAALVESISDRTGTFFRPYSRLAETLPNAKASDGSSVADSVVVGVVSAVTNSAGFVESGRAPTSGNPSARRTAFDDPLASWRTLRVTIDVKEVVAGPAVGTLSLDWPILGSSGRGDDGAAIGRALKELGTVLVMSHAQPTGPEYLGLVRKIADPAYGLGVVATDGSLSFPLVEGGQADAMAFMGDIDTLGELRSAADKPSWIRQSG